MVTYGKTTIPSDQITVLSGGTVAVSVAFENSLGVMGGMDTANGSATEGDVVTVDSPTDAATKFGDGSELHEASKLAFNQGVGTLYMLPVSETSVTGETHSSATGTLDNAPIFDPRVQDEHSITVSDSSGGDLTVNYVDEPSPSQPSASDEINIYPPTGEYAADAGPDGSDYEFDYTYGDYSTTEIAKLIDKSPRIVTVLTENDSVATDAVTEINSRAVDFDFMHLVAGEQIGISNTSTYTNSDDERRLSKLYPARAFTDEADTNEVRLSSAVGGYLASLGLGLSATGDSVGGFSGSLKNELSGPSSAGDLIDQGIMPLLDYPPVEIVKDMTTSDTAKFERVYVMQIVDELTEVSHTINRQFIGEQNTPSNNRSIQQSHTNAYLSAENGTPPLLDDFTVTVTEDTSNDNKLNIAIGLDVVDVIDIIDVTITVGDIIQNGGAQ
jgi:hypothetical protein